MRIAAVARRKRCSEHGTRWPRPIYWQAQRKPRHQMFFARNAVRVMIRSVIADAVFALLRRRPFVPFRLILTSDTTYDILHPEMLFVSKSGLTVAIYDRDQRPSPEEIPMREALVSFLHIAATEDLAQPTSKAG